MNNTGIDVNGRNVVKLKVLVLNDYAYIEGGAGSVAIKSAIGLANRGHEVVFFSAVEPVCKELLEAPFAKIICLRQKDILNNPNKLNASLSGIYNRRAIKEIKKLFNNWRPDIAHIHNVSKALSWAIITAIHNCKVPIIYTLHDYALLCPNMGIYNFQADSLCNLYQSGCGFKCLITNCDKRNYIHKIWRWVRYYFLQHGIGVRRKIKGYIAVSDFIAALFEKHLPSNKPIRVIYNPIVISSSDDSEEVKRPFRKTTFLYLGRLSPEKGIDLLLEAIKRVNANLIIIGDGEMLEKCKASSKEQGEEKIKVLGWQNFQIISEMMKECIALIIPSRWCETASIVIMEAAVNSLPCIVADRGALIEFVKHGLTGLHFKANNVSSLADTMEKMIKTPELAQKLGRRAKEMFESYGMDINTHITKLEQFYLEIKKRGIFLPQNRKRI
ncbi:hypothetical protein CVT91_00275 [Candidatus Atribacteria bacterium HGW-Atribacteria-1]|nr:MAG: hypothetical protein CVT91_00275 [Candidatus Atribacteria bacterium HGW-Atribacteria-1]